MTDSIENKKIRDFITLKPFQGTYTFDNLSPETIIQSYIFTGESSRNFLELFAELAKPPGSDRKAILISGDRGVGKTHSLTVLKEVLRQPHLINRVPSSVTGNFIATLTGKRYLVVDIRCLPTQEENLKELFFTAFQKALTEINATRLPPMENWIELEDSDEQIRFICDFIPPHYEIVIFLDDISEKLISYRNIARIMGDLEFLLTLSLASSLYPVFLIASFYENLLTPPSYTSKYFDLHQKINEFKIPNSFIIKRITKNNILELIRGNILQKTDAQRKQLHSIHQYLGSLFPYFQADEGLFADLYPLNPTAFNISFYLHRYIKNFSILPFVYSTANRCLSYRCTSLASIELIFDLLTHEFKKVPELQIALQSYETIAKIAIPLLEPQQKIPARLILKTLFLFSITEECRPTMENIASALLMTDQQNNPLRLEEIKKILDCFEEQTPQCIRRHKRDDFLEYQLVTIDHGSVDFIIQEALKEMSPDEETVQRQVFQLTFQYLTGLNITRESYTHPVSNEPVLFEWRGTSRPGMACWHEKINDIMVSPLELRTQSILQDICDQSGPVDGTLANRLAAQANDVFSAEEKPFDWQLHIYSPVEPTPSFSEIKELCGRYPALLILVPGTLTEEDRHKFEMAKVLFSEENRYRFFDLEDEYQLRRTSLEKELHAIIQRKYFKDGILFLRSTSLSLEEHNIDPGTLLPFIQKLILAIFDEYYPLHPKFDSDCGRCLNHMKIAEAFVKNLPDTPENREIIAKILSPLGLIQKEGANYLFQPESDRFLESPFITEIIYLIGTYPAEIFPLQLFYQAFSKSPFGLKPDFIDVVLLALVAAGKLKIFQRNRGDLNGLSRMSMAGEIDLSYFDSVQAMEERTLPLPELLRWGFILCNTDEPTVSTITQSRKHLRSMFGEWLEYERANPMDRLIQNVPNDLITTHLWRELQSCHRNAKAIETIVENVCSNQYSLEEGLSLLTKTFSNNLRAFQSILNEIHNIRQFLEWSSFFIEAKNYVLCSEKTKEQALENLRIDLSIFFERPARLLAADKRSAFQNKFTEFKRMYSAHYLQQHEQQQLLLGPDSELAEISSRMWWKNLPTLSRLIYISPYHVKSLMRLLMNLQQMECTMPLERTLENVPRCGCGFSLSVSVSLEATVKRIIETAKVARQEYEGFLANYKKVIIREMQKISSLDDDTAREVVNLINGNLDVPVGLESIKLINFILRRKVKLLPPKAFAGDCRDILINKPDFVHNINRILKDLDESRVSHVLLEGEDS